MKNYSQSFETLESDFSTNSSFKKMSSSSKNKGTKRIMSKSNKPVRGGVRD